MNILSYHHKALAEFTDLLRVHLINGSVLFYFKKLTFENLSMVITSFQINSPADLLVWVTILYSIVKMINIIISWKIWELLRRRTIKLIYKVKPQLKLSYAKISQLAQKYLRRQRR